MVSPKHLNIIPNVIRIATIEEIVVSEGSALPSVCTISFATGERQADVSLPHPTGAGENGIFMIPKKGTRVLVGRGDNNKFFIISYYTGPFLSEFSGQSRFKSTSIDSSPPPLTRAGEVIINGSNKAHTKYTVDGDIISRFGTAGSVSLSPSAKIGTYAEARYTSLASGYSVSGEIMRQRDPIDPSLKNTDRLANIAFDDSLDTIGREPDLPIATSTSGPVVHRNPPFVEKRSVVYDYSRDYLVNDVAAEKDLYRDASSKLGIRDIKLERQGSRTDAFGLGPLQYNILAETILGTAVDVYKNILDLNRNPITSHADASDPDKHISAHYQALRRSIKFHFELNSRKDADSIDLSSSNPAFDGGPKGQITDHSRWSVDVDAEGQTKINIPASSSTGNIPVHARYISSSYLAKIDPSNTDIRKTNYLIRGGNNPSNVAQGELKKDIVHYNYTSTSKESGIEIDDKNNPKAENEKQFRWTMPYHDPSFADILKVPTNRGTVDLWYAGTPVPSAVKYSDLFGKEVLSAIALTNSPSGYKFSNEFGSTHIDPNAGGRSLSANLDGSLELAIGADQADKKSITMDTSGSILARLGKDQKGNSLVLAGDGDAIIVLGASNGSGEGVKIPGGNLKIFVQNPNSGTSSIEIINGNIHIRSAPDKSIVFESGRNIVFSASKDVLINGERVGVFGQYTASGDPVAGVGGVGERPIKRIGEEI